MDVDRLLAQRPLLHRDGDERASYALADEVLRFIDSAVEAGSRTLETGAGVSTVLFAIKGAEHTCVVPFTSEVEDIEAWCAAEEISLEQVTFLVESSERALPQLDPEPLDLVLIDGAHAFPIPFIDWYYAGRRLRRGGILVVDDTQLWTGKVLRQFLAEQPGWDLVYELGTRSAAFQRSGDESPPYWVDQPYVAKRSRTGTARTRARNAAALVRRGEFAALGRKARQRASRAELGALLREAISNARSRRRV